MYSIIQIGGHQYRVQAGDLIDVQKLEGEVGQELEFNQVLFIGGDLNLVGTPIIAGAMVRATVVRQGLGKKILGARRRPGLYFKRKNHRQPYTALRILEMNDGQGKIEKWEAPKPEKNIPQAEEGE